MQDLTLHAGASDRLKVLMLAMTLQAAARR